MDSFKILSITGKSRGSKKSVAMRLSSLGSFVVVEVGVEAVVMVVMISVLATPYPLCLYCDSDCSVLVLVLVSPPPNRHTQ